jgi:hypothetical protein
MVGRERAYNGADSEMLGRCRGSRTAVRDCRGSVIFERTADATKNLRSDLGARNLILPYEGVGRKRRT